MNQKKTKISLFLFCMLLILSACTSTEKEMKEIVGQWYAESGEIAIDVREDGSYDDNGYGTGTWKYLDDGITIEFTDFYGSTKTTTINKDENGYSIFNGKYYKDSYPTNISEEIHIENTTSINDNLTLSIQKAGNFSSGCAWIEYNKDGIEYNGLIDKTGKILFSKEKTTTVENYYALDNALGYYFIYPNKYTLINSKGKILASSENGDFDAILAYGDGQALVYKKVANITEVSHMYGVIDSEGKWIYPFTQWDFEPVFSKSNKPLSFYANDGQFLIQTKNSYGGVYVIFNSQNFEKTFLYDISGNVIREDSFKFINDFAVVVEAHGLDASYMSKKYITELININVYDLPEDITVLPNNFIIYKDGTIKEISDYDRISDNLILRKTNGNWEINDYNENHSFLVSEYPANKVDITFFDNYGFMLITGADEKKYFTLIDRKTGNQFFDPICYTSISYSKECIVYQNKDIDTSYKIVNLTGHIIGDSLEYEDISKFNEGLAYAKLKNGNCVYIDTNGNAVITSVTL